jgi:hypothetical protein
MLTAWPTNNELAFRRSDDVGAVEFAGSSVPAVTTDANTESRVKSAVIPLSTES